MSISSLLIRKSHTCMTACIVIAYIWSLSCCLLKRTTRRGNDKESTQLHYPVYPGSTTGTAAVTKGNLSWKCISFTCDNSGKDIPPWRTKCCTETSQLPIYWHTDISLCLHWFQKSLWQSMACSLMVHHAEVNYQCKSSSHHWAALWKGYKCSPDEAWCVSLSFPYFCMPVNHWPGLLSQRKERRLLR